MQITSLGQMRFLLPLMDLDEVSVDDSLAAHLCNKDRTYRYTIEHAVWKRSREVADTWKQLNPLCP